MKRTPLRRKQPLRPAAALAAAPPEPQGAASEGLEARAEMAYKECAIRNRSWIIDWASYHEGYLDAARLRVPPAPAQREGATEPEWPKVWDRSSCTWVEKEKP